MNVPREDATAAGPPGSGKPRHKRRGPDAVGHLRPARPDVVHRRAEATGRCAGGAGPAYRRSPGRGRRDPGRTGRRGLRARPGQLHRHPGGPGHRPGLSRRERPGRPAWTTCRFWPPPPPPRPPEPWSSSPTPAPAKSTCNPSWPTATPCPWARPLPWPTPPLGPRKGPQWGRCGWSATASPATATPSWPPPWPPSSARNTTPPVRRPPGCRRVGQLRLRPVEPHWVPKRRRGNLDVIAAHRGLTRHDAEARIRQAME